MGIFSSTLLYGTKYSLSANVTEGVQEPYFHLQKHDESGKVFAQIWNGNINELAKIIESSQSRNSVSTMISPVESFLPGRI